MKKVYIFLDEGFEEIEAVSPADILRRAGVEARLISCCGDEVVTGAHGIAYVADGTLSQVKDGELPDGVVLPGGMPGSVNLAENDDVMKFVNRMNDAGRLVAAICAAPAVALAPFGILEGKSFTCYPGMEDEIPAGCTGVWKEDRVVTDGNLVTSRGPGSAGEFGFALVDHLLGEGASAGLRKGMIYR